MLGRVALGRLVAQKSKLGHSILDTEVDLSRRLSETARPASREMVVWVDLLTAGGSGGRQDQLRRATKARTDLPPLEPGAT